MRRFASLSFAALATVVATVLACSGSSQPTGFGGNGTPNNGGGSGGGSGSGSGSGGSGSGSGSGGGNPIPLPVGNGPDSGASGDGGGCPTPNPLNYDIPGDGCDDDGDGLNDNEPKCDTSLPLGPQTGTAVQMLNAMGLCQMADATHWGIVSATYTNGHSSTSPGDKSFDYQHGILSTFGSVVKPQDGANFGVLSSGTADINDTQDQGPYFKGPKGGMQSSGTGDAPGGFPKPAAGCPKGSGVNDVINLKVQIKVPLNAKGFSFDFDFWSGEWPEYVCTDFNDSFIAYLTSQGFNKGVPDNISFDSKNNPVSVNIGFFGVCSPGSTVGCLGTTTSTAVCPAGAGALAGTGFSDPGAYCLTNPTDQSSGGGATGWLTSTAPVKPGETITLEFIIWDTGDNQYDSSVLLDHFVWQGQDVPATPVTAPSPPPK